MHGFVLAGGRSSRMGRDKAMLPFGGRPMVETAVEKLRTFSAAVSISGNRDDLRPFAPVVGDPHRGLGPAAGLEAGLRVAAERWALFLPVDVPLVPEQLLFAWTTAVVGREQDGLRLSYLRADGVRQPAFCLLHKACLEPLTAAVDEGVLKLGLVFERISLALGPASLWAADAETFAAQPADVRACFGNLNTPEDLLRSEAWVRGLTPAR